MKKANISKKFISGIAQDVFADDVVYAAHKKEITISLEKEKEQAKIIFDLEKGKGFFVLENGKEFELASFSVRENTLKVVDEDALKSVLAAKEIVDEWRHKDCFHSYLSLKGQVDKINKKLESEFDSEINTIKKNLEEQIRMANLAIQDLENKKVPLLEQKGKLLSKIYEKKIQEFEFLNGEFLKESSLPEVESVEEGFIGSSVEKPSTGKMKVIKLSKKYEGIEPLFNFVEKEKIAVGFQEPNAKISLFEKVLNFFKS